MNIVIRPAVDGDFGPIGELFFETVRTVNLRDYSPAQVAAWAPAVATAEDWRKRLAAQHVLVAVEGSLLVGFASMESSGHIDLLYVHKDRQRRGIGSRLLGGLMQLARQQGLRRLFTEASITARPLFEHHGFVVTGQEEVARLGQTLCRYRMHREL